MIVVVIVFVVSVVVVVVDHSEGLASCKSLFVLVTVTKAMKVIPPTLMLFSLDWTNFCTRCLCWPLDPVDPAEGSPLGYLLFVSSFAPFICKD